jgi:hypothetical protein
MMNVLLAFAFLALVNPVVQGVTDLAARNPSAVATRCAIEPKKFGYFWDGSGDNNHCGTHIFPPLL